MNLKQRIKNVSLGLTVLTAMGALMGSSCKKEERGVPVYGTVLESELMPTGNFEGGREHYVYFFSLDTGNERKTVVVEDQRDINMLLEPGFIVAIQGLRANEINNPYLTVEAADIYVYRPEEFYHLRE